MTQDEILEMARPRAWYGKVEGWTFNSYEELEAFAKLVAEHQRKNIKHSLVASNVSVQSRVYIGEELISNLRMTHEEIRARKEGATC